MKTLQAWVGAGLLSLGCAGSGAVSAPPQPAGAQPQAGVAAAVSTQEGEPAPAPEQAAPAPKQAAPKPEAPAPVAKKGPPRKETAPLYDTPTERRLYSDQIEASSFLWISWNRFQENYHPNYFMDGDPSTAWVEGVESSGAGEWIRIKLSPLEGTTQVRLRVQNGYQKSDTLFKKNARAKQVTLVALPSKESVTVTLKDATGWQEIALPLKETTLEGVEFRVDSVYEGSKWTDLSMSDVEIYATAKTMENPAFEKAKLERLQEWKKERLAAAAEWKKTAPGTLPIAPGYIVEDTEIKAKVPDMSEMPVYPEDDYSLERVYTSARRALLNFPEVKTEAERALATAKGGRTAWTLLDIKSAKALRLPRVDGLYEPKNGLLDYVRYDSFEILSTKLGSMLLSSGFTALDSKGGLKIETYDCKKGQTNFWRGPAALTDSPFPREVLVETCAERTAEREGNYTERTFYIFEYDDKGRLALVVSEEYAQRFEWREGKTGATLAGGSRIMNYDSIIESLTEAKAKK